MEETSSNTPDCLDYYTLNPNTQPPKNTSYGYVMAPNILEQNTKTGYPLSLVLFLDGPDDWEDYWSGVQTYLVLN